MKEPRNPRPPGGPGEDEPPREGAEIDQCDVDAPVTDGGGVVGRPAVTILLDPTTRRILSFEVDVEPRRRSPG